MNFPVHAATDYDSIKRRSENRPTHEGLLEQASACRGRVRAMGADPECEKFLKVGMQADYGGVLSGCMDCFEALRTAKTAVPSAAGELSAVLETVGNTVSLVSRLIGAKRIVPDSSGRA